MAKRNVLLVDADPRSLRVLEVTLRQAGHNLTIARDGAQGWERLLELVPDLLIADTRLPKLDGYELVKRMKDLPDGALVPVLFLTQQRSVEDKIRGLELGVEDYLSKPIFVRELLARVETMFARSAQRALAVGRAPGTLAQSSGQLRDLSVLDLLQTLEGARKSGVLRVALAGNGAGVAHAPNARDLPDMTGRVYFRSGRAVDAEFGRLRGEEAIYRMLVWRDGTFEVELSDVSRADLIGQPTQAILMEGLRRADEWHRLCEQVPSLDTIFELDHQELEGRLRRVPDELNGVLSLFDGRRSLMQIIDESPFEDLSTLSTVSKLYFEGFLRSTSTTPSSELPVAPPAPALDTTAPVGASTTSPVSEPRWVSAESYESLPALPSSPASDPKAPALLSSPFLPASSAPSLPTAEDVSSQVGQEVSKPSPEPADPPLETATAARAAESIRLGATHAEADPFSERPAAVVDSGGGSEDADEDDTRFSGVGARARPVASEDADDADLDGVGGASKPPPPIVSGRPLVIWGTVLLLGATFAVIGARRCVRGEHDNAAELRLTATAPPTVRPSYVPPPVALPPPPAAQSEPLPSAAPPGALPSSPRALPTVTVRRVHDAPVVVPQRGAPDGAGSAAPHAAEPTSTAPSPTGTSAPSLLPQPSTQPTGPAPEGANGDATRETAAAQRALEQANPGRAAELAKLGTGKNPKDAETWLTLGAAYEAVGQKARARAAYQSCVSRAEGPRVEECRALLSRPY